jgi:hypothetical protein
MKVPILTTQKTLIAILVMAFLIRIAVLSWFGYNRPDYFHNDLQQIEENISSVNQPYQNSFGSEVSNVAYALVCAGRGFSDPFGGKTGPTGWVAPGIVFPYAFAFFIWGCFSYGAIMFLFCLALIASLATVVLVFAVGKEMFGDSRAALLGALFFALSPHDIAIFGRISQQDFNFFPFLFTLIFYLFVCYRKKQTFGKLALFSIIAALSILCNPALSAPIGMCFLFLVFENGLAFRKSIIEILIGVGIILILTLPYNIYQKQKLGTWTFIKSNGLYEIYQGNENRFEGVLTMDLFNTLHPIQNVSEFSLYSTLGETAYIATKFDQFKSTFSISSFVKMSLNKALHFYFLFPAVQTKSSLLHYLFYSLRGIIFVTYFLVRFRRMENLEKLLFGYIVIYSLPYCLAGMMYRYSFPIIPLVYLLFGSLLSRLYTQITLWPENKR